MDYSVRLTGQDNLSGTIKQCKQAVQDFGSTASTTMDKFKQRFERIEGSAAPLKRQLRDLKALMAEMNFKGLAGTDQFTKIAQYAGQVKDAMDDAGAATKRFADDTFALQAAAGAFQAITGATTALTGAMNLFGVKNEEVAQAILRVQSAIAILNGVQAVANALNKDSALMQALKSIKMKIDTEYTRLNTIETTKNTTAVTASRIASEADAVAKGKEAVATNVESAATRASTITTNAWNKAKAISKAMLGDFTGLLILGAASLATYAMATDDSTDSNEAFNSKLDELMGTLVDNIIKFQEIQGEYEKVRGKSEELAKMVNIEKDKFKELGIEVKNANDLHKIMGDKSNDYIIASMNRAVAIASEAEAVETLRRQISSLSKIYSAFLRGEEVEYSDLNRAVKEATGWGNREANQAIKNAGLEVDDPWYNMFILRTAKVKPNPEAYQKLLNTILQKPVEQYQKTLEAMREAMFKQMSDAQKETYESIEKNLDNALNPTKNTIKNTTKGKTRSSQASKEISLTQKEIESLIRSWDGLNKIIEVAQRKKNELDRSTQDYTKQLKLFNDLILRAEKLKYDMIDQSTLQGLGAAKQQIQNIINILPEGSDELDEWNKKLTELNKKLTERALAVIDQSTLKGLSDAKNNLYEIIKMMDIHSPQVAALARHWYEVNKQEREAKETIDDMMNGVDPNSINSLRKALHDLEVSKLNIDPMIEGNIQRINNIEYLIDTLKAEIGKRVSANEVTVTAPVRLDVTFDYKKSNLEKLNERIEFFQNQIESLERIKLEDVGEDMFKKAQENLAKFNTLLHDTKREAVMTEMGEDIREYTKTLREDAYEGVKTFASGISSMYSAIEGLPDKLDDAKNGIEAFTAITETIFSVVDGVKAFIEAINSIIEVMNLLKGAREAHTAMASKETATIIGQTFAMEGAAVAEGKKAAVDASSVAPAAALAAANKVLAMETEQMAASQMFAAHASIPFAGAALGAASVAIMEGTLRSLNALAMFAGGGIVGGNSYSGDKLIARVNSGEMILNSRQQRNLFNAINNGELGGGNTQTVSFRLKGADIYGALKNYQKIKGKSGIVTGIQ